MKGRVLAMIFRQVKHGINIHRWSLSILSIGHGEREYERYIYKDKLEKNMRNHVSTYKRKNAIFFNIHCSLFNIHTVEHTMYASGYI